MTDVVHTGPHRRFRFTTNGVRVEQEQPADVGTVWKTVGSLSDDELRQLYAELDKRGFGRDE